MTVETQKKVERVSLQVGDEELVFETGRIARQAQGAVLVTAGETMVLSTVCVAPEARPGQGFFPLTVEYREKSSSAGRIPGNFFRREGRPSEREILVCRLTDRPIRPLFPKGFLNELLVFSTVFSADAKNNPDVLSINGASAALHLSRVPFKEPIGAVRVGLIDDELVVNPPVADMIDSDADIVLAGTRDAITMVEGDALELSEDQMVEALEFGHAEIVRIIEKIEELRERAGDEKMEFTPPAYDAEATADFENLFDESRMVEALAVADKHGRQAALDEQEQELLDALKEKYGEERFEEVRNDVESIFHDKVKNLMRKKVLDSGVRLDGRRTDEVRAIDIEVGILPRAHGSCLFTRGETQALVSTTLGTSRDEQRLDELTGEEFRRFMLHYNFPPYSVGEVRRISGPGRREIGHGKLAERAMESLLPLDDEDEFPYTVRVLSDITESNGSSSMATVCGGTLSLMDAGVPIDAPVAGIAMGLIKEGEQAAVLTDILGAEDHLGDMDFKVCGTREGITAFQMDCKIAGVSGDLMKQALNQAREARLHVLQKMEDALNQPRDSVSKYAPRIYTLKIDVEKIRDVIGPGGKVVREIQNKTGAEVDIEDDGTINVAAVDGESADAALEMIKQITAVPEIGKVYLGRVARIMNFGAFVTIMGNKDGLVHISELAPGHVNEVEDVVRVGDEVHVKVTEIDKMGRLNLSKVQAEREMGLISEADEEAASRDSGKRGGRGKEGGGRDRDRGGDRGGDRDKRRRRRKD
jgi:polyribonucleotide nucleotidyltransferase